MKNRLASPPISLISMAFRAWPGSRSRGATSIIGALTRHADVATNADVIAALPALAALAGNIGDPACAQSRHHRRLGRQQRSGGGLSGGVPGAWGDYSHQQAQDRGFRVLHRAVFDRAGRWRDHHQGFLPAGGKFAYAKFPNPASRYAMVGVAVAKRGGEVRVAVTGAGSDGVFRWSEAEKALSARFSAKSLGWHEPSGGRGAERRYPRLG
jgi:carbon-monoxide dehydrogenase medium subunit